MFKFVYDGASERNELCFGFGREDMTHVEVAEYFNQFLRGCGYIYDGEYALVEDHFGDTANEDGKGAFPVI